MADLEGKKQETKPAKPETLIFHAIQHQKLRTVGLQALLSSFSAILTQLSLSTCFLFP